MKVRINNFGPVRGKQNYVIDLSKQLTIVTGGNGLGKTYLGYMVYGLLKRFSEITLNDNRYILDKWIEKDKSYYYLTLSPSRFQKVLNMIFNVFYEDLPALLGVDRKTADMIFNQLGIQIIEIDSLHKEYMDSKIELKNGGDDTLVAKEEGEERIKLPLDDENESTGKTAIAGVMSFFVKKSILKLISIRRVYYIPVERNSLYTFSKELSLKRSEIIDQMHNFLINSKKEEDTLSKLLKRNSNRYPEAIEDALRQAQDLTQLTKSESEPCFLKLANEIETDILQGTINISSDGEVEFVPQKSRRKKVPVHLSASFIKTISSVLLFLKHTGEKGDMVMIDEPEMNLHPDMQILFARILVKMSNSGIKVWLSTHSDYVISEINNMFLAGVLIEKGQEEKVLEWGYNKGVSINKDNAQALYLDGEEAKTQVKIKNLNISDQGIDIASINTTLERLNERSNELEELYENLD
ncbi:AAA family ATPase [Sediminitomix flava]|uniref:AAA ATPase-like protein n=1 Tax=Sediminitomix flava TaxID=379075 RepID=A0A315ZB14_SEDFL|nr:AAA family ATPase [Sediminitomix flava]PWJ42243.1 AAA ATPase-like protein [Sediminitomix flava]